MRLDLDGLAAASREALMAGSKEDSNQGGGLLSPNVATNAAIFPGRFVGR